MPPSLEVPAVRVILSDDLVGGQKVRTFPQRPATIDQVVNLLKAHFNLEGICRQRGIRGVPSVVGGGLRMQGLDGLRRVPLLTDGNLSAFLVGLKNSRLPTIEVRLANSGRQTSKSPPRTAGGSRSRTPGSADNGQRGRQPRDRVEQLEDDNFKLLRASDRVERRVVELERLVAGNREEQLRIVEVAQRKLTLAQEKAVQAIEEQIKALRGADAAIIRDLDTLRTHLDEVEQQDKNGDEELAVQMEHFNRRVTKNFEEVRGQLELLKQEDQHIWEEAGRTKEEHRKHLTLHDIELTRLDEVKVEETKWREEEDKMAERITQELADLAATLREEEAEHIRQAREEAAERSANIEEAARLLEERTTQAEAYLTRLDGTMQAGLKTAEEHLQAVRAELLADTKSKVSSLADSTEQRFSSTKTEITSKDMVLHRRVDELTAKSDTTFKSLHERLEEMVRVERARLGQIERDIAESTTKIRSDCRAEIERVRNDYEQEAARLDADLGDLHMKHDVTKQEINFFNSRLLEQREWSQRQFAEGAMATRAASVDAQEGLAAVTKMLHALRDDAVSFREKMAKYISLLQHSADSQGDAITTLETQRSRMRSELDALINDHRAYTSDMDGWADDVRVKVERLFRAMEPTRVEWRIMRAPQRAKELKRPLALKSPSFSLKGLRQVHLEFYPEGTNTSPDGLAVLRLFFPSSAHVRYQVWVGRSSDGPREYLPGANFLVDINVEQWKDQILDDGTVPVFMEVLRDHTNDDESLSREVRIESP